MLKIEKNGLLKNIFTRKFIKKEGEVLLQEDNTGKDFEDLYLNFNFLDYYYGKSGNKSKLFKFSQNELSEFLTLFKNLNGEEKISLEIEGEIGNYRGEVFYEEGSNRDINYIIFRKVIEPPSFFDTWKSHLNLIRSISKTMENRENILISGIPGSGKSTFINSLIYEANENVDGEYLIKKLLNEKVFSKENIRYKMDEDIDKYISLLKSLKKIDDNGVKEFIKTMLGNPIISLYDKYLKNKSLFTIENPIEYKYKESKGLRIMQNENSNFKKMIEKSLRSNPDLIFIQEIKTVEEYEAFLQTGMNGIPALSTNHSGSVFKNLEKIVNFGKDKNIKNNIVNSISLLINFKRYKNKENIFLISYETLYLNKEISSKFLVEDNFQIFENSIKNSSYLDDNSFEGSKPIGKPIYVSHIESLLYTMYLYWVKNGIILTLLSGEEVFNELEGDTLKVINNNLITYYDLIDEIKYMEFFNKFTEKYL